MTDPDALNVWNNQLLVGHLWRNATGTIGFRYDPQWIAQGGFAVSHTLPLGNDDFTSYMRSNYRIWTYGRIWTTYTFVLDS